MAVTGMVAADFLKQRQKATRLHKWEPKRILP